jgi:predicted RNA-binding Zn-ribbon protein involved in translation (DUF1610 family)
MRPRYHRYASEAAGKACYAAPRFIRSLADVAFWATSRERLGLESNAALCPLCGEPNGYPKSLTRTQDPNGKPYLCPTCAARRAP